MRISAGVQTCALPISELVKTGLDLLEFPTIVFLQSGYNVYSLQQAARRSWRIGQKQPVRVVYLGYANSSQMTCLGLMAKKIMVSQRSEEHTSELQSLMRISYAVFCLKKKKQMTNNSV